MKPLLAIICGLVIGNLSHAAIVPPSVFADQQQGALFTVSDGTNLYWTNNVGSSGGEVMSMPIAGGSPKILAKGTGPRRLRVFNGNIYWADTDSESIRSVPTGGGDVTILASGQNKPMGLFISGDYIYWTNAGIGLPDGSIMRIALAGGTPEVLAKDLNMPMGLVVVNDTIYWSTVVREYKIFSLGLNDKTPKTIADAYASTIASDNENIYWVDAIKGTIMAMHLKDGTQTQLASHQKGPSSLFSDGEFVYWTTQGENHHGTVMKVPVTGGTPVTLSENRAFPYGISTDAENIYWADHADAVIYKLRK